MRILISGSREASPAMLAYARKCVRRARELGATILVGDNPRGIDAAVIDAADEIGAWVDVHGAYGKLRKCSRQGVNSHTTSDYTQRDQEMVEQLVPGDVVMAIWNGRSRGTRAVYDYAAKRGIEAHLKQF